MRHSLAIWTSRCSAAPCRCAGLGITLEHYRNAWWIDAGTVHGIEPPQGDEATVLAVLPRRDPDTRRLAANDRSGMYGSPTSNSPGLA